MDYNKISYDIEPILETGMSFDNIVIGDYCNVVNPYNNHGTIELWYYIATDVLNKIRLFEGGTDLIYLNR